MKGGLIMEVKYYNSIQAWENNMCMIYAYKSDRKNAKIISDVTMRHLITHNENNCVDENCILDYFTGIIAQLVTDIKYSSNTINISAYTTTGHATSYIDANNELYTHEHTKHISNCRLKFYSIECLIVYLFDRLLDVYPYTRLDLYTVFNHPSIQYYINLYYQH